MRLGAGLALLCLAGCGATAAPKKALPVVGRIVLFGHDQYLQEWQSSGPVRFLDSNRWMKFTERGTGRSILVKIDLATVVIEETTVRR